MNNEDLIYLIKSEFDTLLQDKLSKFIGTPLSSYHLECLNSDIKEDTEVSEFMSNFLQGHSLLLYPCMLSGVLSYKVFGKFYD